MEIGVEISLYPLAEEFGPPIKAFLERLRGAGRLKVVTTSLSTQIFGDYDEVLGVLNREMRAALEGVAQGGAGASGAPGAPGAPGGAGRAVFIVKVFGPLAPAP